MECSGGVRESRFRCKNRFDGVHMYGVSGRKAYTESVLRIVRDAGLVRNQPPTYFRRFHMTGDKSTPSSHKKYSCPTEETDWKNDKDIRVKKYSIPTSNRFTPLNPKN